jgi:hypothetical protein
MAATTALGRNDGIGHDGIGRDEIGRDDGVDRDGSVDVDFGAGASERKEGRGGGVGRDRLRHGCTAFLK